MKTKQYGDNGEDIAVHFLEQKGYTIVDRNWHNGHKELDIVARTGNTLVFIEVKRRSTELYGNAADAINERKIRCLVDAANRYIKRYAIDLECRFDVITVTGIGAKMCIEHIENAFIPPIWN